MTPPGLLRSSAALAVGTFSALLLAPGTPTTAAAPTRSNQQLFVSIRDVPTLGDAGAPVVLVEFSDFHCPFCRRHVNETLPLVKQDYIDTGRLLYAFRHFPLDIHPRAPDAAVAAMCAARQGKFWELHARLFAAPRPVAPEALEGHAKAVGVSVQRYRTCVNAGVARDDVRLDVEEARRLGLGGTPGFALGLRDLDDRVRVLRRAVGFQPYADLKKAIDGVLGPLGQSGPTPRSST